MKRVISIYFILIFPVYFFDQSCIAIRFLLVVKYYNSASMQHLPCNFNCSQPQLKLKQTCPKHPNYYLTHFCSNNTCLELICNQCLKPHQLAHQAENISDQNIRSLVQIEHYYETSSRVELEYQKERQQKGVDKNRHLDPCEIMCQLIDGHFYGSNQNKIQNLKHRKKVFSNPTPLQFIDIVQKSANYKVKENFKEKYFAFLNQLFHLPK